MATINFSGIASGIDTTTLIKSILDQQRATRIKPLEDKRTSLSEVNSSLGELKSLLRTLSDKAQNFRGINGGALTKTVVASDETIVSASASNGAGSGTYSVTVAQRAKNGTFSYNDRFSSESAILNSSINNGSSAADRTVEYTIGTGGSSETVSVTVTNTTTAADFVSSFNSQSTLASASLVNTGSSSSPAYAIVINSKNEGTERGTITQASIGSELAAGAGALQTSTLSQALNAELSLTGLSGTISRTSNTVSDVIPGVTLSLQSLGTTQITVATDRDSTAANVRELVDAFNGILQFVSENDLITQEQGSNGSVTNIFNPLARTSLDENLVAALRTSLTQTSLSGGSVNSLADLGFSTQRDGSLAFDDEAFLDALTRDESSADTILTSLSELFGGVDGTIASFTRFGGQIDSVLNSNNSTISDYNRRISEVEAALAKQEESLTRQYARLEGVIGQLNSQQGSLAALLPR
jgi:flagellar hook-associated protein 2